MKETDTESTDWAIAHIRSYLSGEMDIEGFWQPIDQITEPYENYPHDPSNRLAYFWELVGEQAVFIVKLGHSDDEPRFRGYLERWLDALQRSDDEWREIVSRVGRPLEHDVPDWDTYTQ